MMNISILYSISQTCYYYVGSYFGADFVYTCIKLHIRHYCVFAAVIITYTAAQTEQFFGVVIFDGPKTPES